MTQSIDVTTKTISRIIDSAKKEVLISSGKLVNACYESGVILDSVKRAKQRNVKFRVIVGPKIDTKSKSFISLLKDDVYMAQVEPSFHFAVADGKNLRFETSDINDDGHSENVEHWGDLASGGYLRSKFFASLPKARLYTSSSNIAKDKVKEQKEELKAKN